MDISQLQNLLTDVSAIRKQYEKVAVLTGENFNIFNILRAATDEVKTHSAFIAELLKPNGSHGKGHVFLKEFVCIIKDRAKNKMIIEEAQGNIVDIQFDTENVNFVKVEQWLGRVNEKEGGFIDILLEDKETRHIIIENKIYAGDQKNQLLRYHHSYEDAPLIYLTLYGSPPSKESTGNNKKVLENVICISYHDEIINWLQECKKYVVDVPIIRESLTQYIYLLKQLTNQSTNTIMSNEIVTKLLKSPENIESALGIQRVIPVLKKQLCLNFMKEMKLNFPEYNVLPSSTELGIADSYISISKENWKNELLLYFNLKNSTHSFLIGFRYKNKNQITTEEQEILKKEMELRNEKSKLQFEYLGWNGWAWLIKYDKLNLSTIESWAKLSTADFINHLSKDIKQIFEYFENDLIL